MNRASALGLVSSLAFAAASFGLAAPAHAGAREHDGFFLRVGLGGGSLHMQREGHLSIGSSSSYLGSSTIAGGASAFELSLGGALRPGLVLAGTLQTHTLGKPTMERENDTDLALDGPLTFLALGASLDWFPNPRGGFHVGGGASFAGAWVESPKPAFTEYLGGAGGAVSAHVGYLFWLGDEWSLGALLRVTGARVHGEDTQLGITGSEDDDVRTVSVMASAVFN